LQRDLPLWQRLVRDGHSSDAIYRAAANARRRKATGCWTKRRDCPSGWLASWLEWLVDSTAGRVLARPVETTPLESRTPQQRRYAIGRYDCVLFRCRPHSRKRSMAV